MSCFTGLIDKAYSSLDAVGLITSTMPVVTLLVMQPVVHSILRLGRIPLPRGPQTLISGRRRPHSWKRHQAFQILAPAGRAFWHSTTTDEEVEHRVALPTGIVVYRHVY